MNGADVLRIVDAMHREKNIPKDIIFEGIEAALQLAAERAHGGGVDEDGVEIESDEPKVTVSIDRMTGEIKAAKGDLVIDPGDLGRIAAQSAKQVMIQKIREAECNSVFEKYERLKGELVRGTVQRVDAGTAIVTVDRNESILPRSEQIPGETVHPGDTVKAVVLEVRKAGQRVKVVLSRNHPDFVRCLFEQEIPEVADHTIEIKAIAREAGYRTKIAVTSIDLKVDAVGACVGVRGSRIKNIIDELNGERIDIVRWNDSLQVMIPNALQPANIEEVFLYSRLGRAIVLVQEDQLSLAIGRRGQNVRLASKLVGWDIEIMTHDEYNDGIDRAERWFTALPNVQPEMVETLIVEGFLSYTDLTFLDAAGLSEIIGVTEEQGDEMIACAEEWAEEAEEQARQEEEEAQRAREAEKARILGEAGAAAPAEAKPTVESVFGPTEPEPVPDEVPLTAAQVFGDAPEATPAPAGESERPAE
jgi:transcription termination/antitermination protein NusA